MVDTASGGLALANSPIQSFITGTRAMLSAQLLVSIGVVALAGWTLGVTNELTRERDRLQERVIQLEETMAARGDIPPAPTAVIEPARARGGDAVYPGTIEGAVAPIEDGAPAVEGPTRAPVTEGTDTAPRERDIGSIVTGLFSPAPPLRTIVLHVRSREDAAVASRIARALQADGDQNLLIDVMPPGDTRQSGYAYFDGRQNRAAADMVTSFHEAARTLQVAQWSAQLRGVALPAQGEYTADRLDIVLPPLPPPPAPPAPPEAAATTPTP